MSFQQDIGSMTIRLLSDGSAYAVDARSGRPRFSSFEGSSVEPNASAVQGVRK